MYRKLSFLFLAVILFAQCTQDKKGSNSKMDSFIDDLMSKMTVEEKLGQLNLPGAGDITTGQASSSDIGK
ncbi:MAG TPA: hypothetical protein VIS75_06225, partial [Chitinophagaceae bacterium]